MIRFAFLPQAQSQFYSSPIHVLLDLSKINNKLQIIKEETAMFSDIPSYQVEEVQLNQQDWEEMVHEYTASENDNNGLEQSFKES